MRLFFAIFLSSLCSAASAAQPPLPGLQALPPPPVFDPAARNTDLIPAPVQPSTLPPDDHARGAALGQEVTVTKEVVKPSIEEYRVGGKLYMIKVTPKVGPPYYLIDDMGDGKFTHYDHLDPGFRPPTWVIHRF